MAVGNFPFPSIESLKGIGFGVTCAGIRRNDRDDLLIIELADDSNVAGVFTQNAFSAAPVIVAREHLKQCDGKVRYLLINAGNANACTGEQGKQDALDLCEAVARAKNVATNQVLPFSTGVVGERLPLQKILVALPNALQPIQADAWLPAAKAIMTTDTRPKGATAQCDIDGAVIKVSGFAKGVGMIKPNMATMLAYIATDAKLSQAVVEQLVKECADCSFNRIVVDGDTSTNDACMLMATGSVDMPIVDKTEGPIFQKIKSMIEQVCLELAHNLIRDGEGATKFVEVSVTGGANADECKKVAYTVAQSPLVKTALFASDPNWGRIVVATGYAGIENLNPDKVNVWLGDVMIVEKGQRAASYTEEAGQTVVNKEEIVITIDLGRGSASETVWTTDFSYDYVKINAEYRT